MSFVNSIMQYSSPSPDIPSLKWGRQNEEKARKCYRNEMDKHHSNFSIRSTGKSKDKWGFGGRTTVTLYVGPMKAMLLQELNTMWIFLKILLVNVSTLILCF